MSAALKDIFNFKGIFDFKTIFNLRGNSQRFFPLRMTDQEMADSMNGLLTVEEPWANVLYKRLGDSRTGGK